ncbi:MAG: dihydroxy-acid dehydratase [Syntrophaceae bacterium]|nr:dihydroxy-acid dehydratase [Syntrophaceae bacterium]
MAIQQRGRPFRENWLQIDTLRCGMDWSEEDLERPQILIDDVFGHSHAGSFHLDSISQEVSKGVYQGGGKPSEFHVTDICDGWAMGHDGMNYILLSREIICEMVEVHAAVLPWDGIVLVSSCDKAIPAHLMAASRINIPALHIPGGSARLGPDMTHSAKSGEITSGYKQGRVSKEEARPYILSCDPSSGACQFMGTASTMQCMSEALGMALPGAALIPATLREIYRYARKAGQRVMELAERGIRVSDILTREAFLNAIKVHAAIAGSTNALLHLPAIGHELGIEITCDDFEKANRSVPYLTDIQPSGRFLTELFWFAGGIPRVQWEIRDLLNLDVLTVTGKTLKENLEDLKKEGFFERNEGWLRNHKLSREDVIRQAKNASLKGSIAVLKGSLAPEGAVIKFSAVAKEMLVHTGPAIVFDREEEALAAVLQKKIKPGDVIIIRYEGPRGTGMPEMLATTEALAADPLLSKTTALITDGRYSGATRGPCIGHVCPEAARGGPIALVENGDLIRIDIPQRRLEVVGIQGTPMSPEKVEENLHKRRQRWKMPEFPRRSGVLKRYTQSAAPASKGAYTEY